ncbi:hypothetical protein VCR14J2_300575 [Vibrio coralliirubri]|nr:hypothetical protein VCR14J2_300575 [Vibrio coralliirubri]CDU14054.1 hypothetical protein VCR17J2_610073 [Vibrio coralliirubri]
MALELLESSYLFPVLNLRTIKLIMSTINTIVDNVNYISKDRLCLITHR